MRQVPKYLIIGNGRVARHLAHYFDLLKIKTVSRWDRSQPLPRLLELAAGSTHILLAIKDDAIEPFIDAHLADVAVCEHVKALNAAYAELQAGVTAASLKQFRDAIDFFNAHHDKPLGRKHIAQVAKAASALQGAGNAAGLRRLGEKLDVLKKGLRKNVKIHFSGSLVTRKAYGAHPLMTFGPELYTLEKYLAIPFVVDERAPPFRELFPGLHNRNVRLAEKQKAKYHALCVMAGNFSCLLWQKLFDGLGEFGIPPNTADMYLRQQAENLLADYKNALTGPLMRGDEATIARNLKALEGDAFRQIYEAFVQAYPFINKQTPKNRERKAS